MARLRQVLIVSHRSVPETKQIRDRALKCSGVGGNYFLAFVGPQYLGRVGNAPPRF